MRVAHCLVGDPREAFLENAAVTQNIQENILLSLAPRDSGTHLRLFGILHNPELPSSPRLNEVHTNNSLTYSSDLILERMKSLVHGEPHLKLGEIVVNSKPGCESEKARKRLSCCTQKVRKNRSRGMLINFWQDECYQIVVNFERKNNYKFDWISKSRPDLVCILPLPFIGHLPNTHVYTSIKERGELWDTLFLIPRKLLDSFRNISMFAIDRGNTEDCVNSGRNKVPEVALYFDMIRSQFPVQRLPLSCVLDRQGVSGKATTKKECIKRLNAHALCSLYPWSPANSEGSTAFFSSPISSSSKSEVEQYQICQVNHNLTQNGMGLLSEPLNVSSTFHGGFNISSREIGSSDASNLLFNSSEAEINTKEIEMNLMRKESLKQHIALVSDFSHNISVSLCSFLVSNILRNNSSTVESGEDIRVKSKLEFMHNLSVSFNNAFNTSFNVLDMTSSVVNYTTYDTSALYADEGFIKKKASLPLEPDLRNKIVNEEPLILNTSISFPNQSIDFKNMASKIMSKFTWQPSTLKDARSETFTSLHTSRWAPRSDSSLTTHHYSDEGTTDDQNFSLFWLLGGGQVLVFIVFCLTVTRLLWSRLCYRKKNLVNA